MAQFYDSSNDEIDHGSLISPAQNVHKAEQFGHLEVDLTGESRSDIPSEMNATLDRDTFIPRPYQTEMLEESLRRNVIVAMDTGSGKTHIAVLRIMAELDNAPPHKLMWFLAPTVSLCAQQFSVLSSYIPAVGMKFLSGLDNVDKWRGRDLWDALLKNVRVVVSTYQILYDALSHGSVRLDNLALLIFDEAHHCVKSYPGSMIMRDFYKPDLAQRLPVPHILGLSASPIMSSNPESLGNIEETLNALCRTPIKYRTELSLYVRMPELCTALYRENDVAAELVYPNSLKSLQSLYSSLNILNDPYIIGLRAENTEKSKRQLAKALEKQKTWCQDQMKTFYGTSLIIFQDLGAWAVDYYIWRVVSKFVESIESNHCCFESAATEEKSYLCWLLKQIQPRQPLVDESVALPVSDKVIQFINALPLDGKSFGIAFVKQRATVAVLSRILSVHPVTRDRMRVGTMVGTSQNDFRGMGLKDLIEPEQQRQALQKFRTGELDLIIGTDVLEEGIDVPACNLVICFDQPGNLKSFVQRRGRARMRQSRFILMLPSTSDKLTQWQALEVEMKAVYGDHMRQLKALEHDEAREEHDKREFRVEHNRALLNLDNAVSKLYHFCDMLPVNQYVDLRPEFVIIPGQVAKVILPICVDVSVRVNYAKKIWLAERNAKKDAAYEAYIALYRAGLVNDNLLPLRERGRGEEQYNVAIEKRPSLVHVSQQLTPWLDISKQWTRTTAFEPLKRTRLTLRAVESEPLAWMDIWLPNQNLSLPPIHLSSPDGTAMVINTNSPPPGVQLPQQAVTKLQADTRVLLRFAFGWRYPVDRLDFVALFSSPSCLEGDYTRSSCSQPVESFAQLSAKGSTIGLIRDTTEKQIPYVFDEWLNAKPSSRLIRHPSRGFDELPTEEAYLAVRRLSRSTSFLHKNSIRPPEKPFAYVLPANRCTVDDMPFKEVQFAMMIPFVMRRLEMHLVAQALSQNLLAKLKFVDVNLLLCAISASSANEVFNYQRLEFLGDSVLKLCTTVQLLAEYPLWHEGYLSAKKDQIVSNSRLAKAALQVGLDRYILTKSFSVKKWRPPYVQDLILHSENSEEREMSTKVLADVIEALIGAACVEGGVPKALACMQLFLPEIRWRPLEERRAEIYKSAPYDGPLQNLPRSLVPLQDLVGYTFSRPSLLVEAMTHASCSIGVASFERLEFLGDAVLDRIIVKTIYGWSVEKSHMEMHGMRSALVNADFLAFMCMEWAFEQETCSVEWDKVVGNANVVRSTMALPLWKFMRHASAELANIQIEISKQHFALRGDINKILAVGFEYPWALLSRLQAKKFYSDIVESLLGAVYIDSGSFEACEQVLERIGIMPYLRRILHGNIHILHPKEELGMLADSEEVKYVLGLEKKIRGSVETREYTCEVFIGERNIVKVGDGVNREEVKTRAAETAVKILKANN